jgi:hypothetical protein
MTCTLSDPEKDQLLIADFRMFAQLRDTINPDQDVVRLHSAALRRILLEGDLASASAIRRIPIVFHVPDSMPFVRAARNNHVIGFNLAGLEVFGIQIAGGKTSRGPLAPVDDFDPSKLVPLKLDSFLKQTVAFAGGEFISRYDVISYVANKIGGVHYDKKPSKALPDNKIRALGLFRRSMKMGIHEGIPSIQWFLPDGEDQSERFRYEPEFIDAVYLEFLSCIWYMLESPEIQALQNAIKAEQRS